MPASYDRTKDAARHRAIGQFRSVSTVIEGGCQACIFILSLRLALDYPRTDGCFQRKDLEGTSGPVSAGFSNSNCFPRHLCAWMIGLVCLIKRQKQ